MFLARDEHYLSGHVLSTDDILPLDQLGCI